MRQGAGYHSLETDVAFASATNLRIHRQDKAFVDKFMPQADLFLGAPQVTWENYFQLLKYQIVTNPDLTGIFQVNQLWLHQDQHFRRYLGNRVYFRA